MPIPGKNALLQANRSVKRKRIGYRFAFADHLHPDRARRLQTTGRDVELGGRTFRLALPNDAPGTKQRLRTHIGIHLFSRQAPAPGKPVDAQRGIDNPEIVELDLFGINHAFLACGPGNRTILADIDNHLWPRQRHVDNPHLAGKERHQFGMQ